jgi:hypothetical protein
MLLNIKKAYARNRNLVKKIAFTSIGALLGYGYYYYIGCSSGACPITGNPYISTIYGAVVGFVLSINTKKKQLG